MNYFPPHIKQEPGEQLLSIPGGYHPQYTGEVSDEADSEHDDDHEDDHEHDHGDHHDHDNQESV